MNLKEYYKKYYDKNHYTMAEWKDYSRYAFIKKYAEKAILKLNKPIISVLDVGCGDAFLSEHFKDHDYFGVDINVDKAITARAKECDFEENGLPYSDEFFDLVICSEVLEHLIDPLKTLQEINRVLHKDGIAIISTPNHNWIDYKLHNDVFTTAYRKHIPHTFEHIRHYDHHSFIDLFDSSGLLIKEFTGCDAQYSIFFQPARAKLLKILFDEEIIRDDKTKSVIQTENLTQVDMLLGECFPLDSHTIMFYLEKLNETI